LFGRANFSHHRGDRGCLKAVRKGGHLNVRERDKQEVGKHCKTRSYTVLTLRQTLLGYRNHRGWDKICVQNFSRKNLKARSNLQKLRHIWKENTENYLEGITWEIHLAQDGVKRRAVL